MVVLLLGSSCSNGSLNALSLEDSFLFRCILIKTEVLIDLTVKFCPR